MMRSPERLFGLAGYLIGLVAMGCSGPDISYGENVTLWPRQPINERTGGAGGAGGLSPPAHGSGAGGFVQPPEVVPPELIPDAFEDAGMPSASADAGVARDAGAMTGAPSDEPYCPRIPPALLDPSAGGFGHASGCEEFVCLSSTSFAGLDVNSVWTALTVYDPSAYEGCTGVIGDVIVHNYGERDLGALSCLEVISGSLVILNAPELESLHGLEQLRHVAQDVIIGHSAVATSDVGKLADLRGLSQLNAVRGTFALRAPLLATLDGLQALRVVGESLEISGAASLYDLSGLSGLQAVGGSIVLSGAAGLRGLGGADALQLIGGSFHLDGSVQMRAMQDGFPDVRCIGGGVEILGPSSALEELDVFAALERVGGSVSVLGNDQLQSIAMLGNVQDVRGSIAVQQNPQLARLDLGSLESLGGVMLVTDNPQLEECPLIELAEALDRADGSQIRGNSRSLGCPAPDPLP